MDVQSHGRDVYDSSCWIFDFAACSSSPIRLMSSGAMEKTLEFLLFGKKSSDGCRILRVEALNKIVFSCTNSLDTVHFRPQMVYRLVLFRVSGIIRINIRNVKYILQIKCVTNSFFN